MSQSPAAWESVIFRFMSETPLFFRSPELMSVGETALLVVDVQEKLVPFLHDRRRVLWNMRRLVDGARILGIPTVATEQYPKGLGPTVPELKERLGEIPSKLSFSCCGCEGLLEPLQTAVSGRSSLPGSKPTFASSKPCSIC